MITYIVRLVHSDDYEVEEIEVRTLAEAEELAAHYENDDYYSMVDIIAYAYTPGTEKREATIDVLNPEKESSYKYNVQIWYSPDGGNNFYYTGNGRMCESREEVEAYVTKEMDEGRKTA